VQPPLSPDPTLPPVLPPAQSLQDLQAAVNVAYQELTQAIASGDAEKIKAARDKYSLAQKALELARQN
ncbi:hypothetical protein HOF92_16505, partial [bacterium]|nr:hypothetical protein [bacterium]